MFSHVMPMVCFVSKSGYNVLTGDKIVFAGMTAIPLPRTPAGEYGVLTSVGTAWLPQGIGWKNRLLTGSLLFQMNVPQHRFQPQYMSSPFLIS